MNQRSLNTGGLKEAKDYMIKNDIPQLFESMMTALMYEKPEDHLKFLETCLQRAKVEDKVRWQTFIEPLPQIPKADGKIKSEITSSKVKKEETLNHSRNFAKEDLPLPPISLQATPSKEERIANPNQLTEKVFSKHLDLKNNEEIVDKPWYAEYIEREIDTSCLTGKPVIFVLGGPGSGKGTQCQKIAEKYKFTHLSAGDLLRGEVAKGTDIGKKIDTIMKEGQLVPQDVTIALLKENLVANAESEGFLVDGFPREIKQGQQFEIQVCLAKMVLNYVCPDETLVTRLLARAKHSGRVDDNEESIKKRLVLFHSKTEPVVKYYEEIVANIQADRSIEEVFADTCNSLDRMIFNKFNINKPVLFIMGGPSSGKTTQCAKISEKFNFAHISVTDILNMESTRDTEVGLMIKDILSKENQSVPQDIVLQLLKDEIQSHSNVNGYLLDGFPLDISHAQQFEIEISPASLVLVYNCHDDVLTDRMMQSHGEANRELIEKRLSAYNTSTTPIFLSYQDKIKMIDASDSIESVFVTSTEVVNQLLNPGKLDKQVEDLIFNEDVIVAEQETKCESVGEYRHILADMLKNKQVLCIIGYPKSGKTTQSTKLSSHLGYKHISIKDLSKEQVNTADEQGVMIKEAIPEAVRASMIAEEIMKHDHVNGFVIDDFPSNLSEAESFNDKVGRPSKVLFLQCDEVTSRNRSVDINEAFDKPHHGNEVGTFYTDVVSEVSANDGIEETFNTILEKLDSQSSGTSNAMTAELSNANIIFVLGGPGSGKGTQCDKIVAKYGFCHLSTGDLLRAEVNSDTDRANQLKEIMAKGELVSQETILELLRDAMIKNKDCKGFLIDGFPRDIPQGKKFEETVGRCKCILYFHCKNEVMVERLLGRAKTSGRVDDNEETIKKRLKTFEDQTLPVVGEYKDRVKQIDAERNVDEIFADVCNVIESL